MATTRKTNRLPPVLTGEGSLPFRWRRLPIDPQSFVPFSSTSNGVSINVRCGYTIIILSDESRAFSIGNPDTDGKPSHGRSLLWQSNFSVRGEASPKISKVHMVRNRLDLPNTQHRTQHRYIFLGIRDACKPKHPLHASIPPR